MPESYSASAAALPADALFQARPGEITQMPTVRQVVIDRAFRTLCLACGALTLALAIFIVLRIGVSAAPAIQRYGLGFLTGRVWNPNAERYGILGEIWGTLYTSSLALLIGTAFGLAAAVFMSEGYLGQAAFAVLRRAGVHLNPFWAKVPDQLEHLLKNLVELLAAIPSVVYGLWGLFVVIPLIRPVCEWLHAKLGWLPFFSTDLSGPGVLPAVLVLSIMILPTASRGILGGIVLAFGRALGETMALAMLVGNSNQITVSIFSPANTLAALLANNFPEAGARQVSVLMYAALMLLAITLVVNIVGAVIIQRASRLRAD